MPVTVTFWRPVVLKRYKNCDGICHICRLRRHCNTCTFIASACGHGYHTHCLKNNNICFVCREPIQVRK
ncbi:ring-h2 zinc finger [Pteropox virus]|uniref:Ring-h2 zinc finger n=1 Tax=Pteropox virus TaxID=1873698 RepID=A0A1B1MRE6_9POXV|nr:ring-h2 zinc finger [Pteropox virus]ANS71109.1 ring-h2 zinc finger [Pteropox virus]